MKLWLDIIMFKWRPQGKIYSQKDSRSVSFKGSMDKHMQAWPISKQPRKYKGKVFFNAWKKAREDAQDDCSIWVEKFQMVNHNSFVQILEELEKYDLNS